MEAEQSTVVGRVPAVGIVLAATVLATALIGGVAGCSANGTLPAYVATYETAGSGGSAALLEGDLERSNGCVTLIDSEGVNWLPVFPEHASVTDGSIRVGNSSYTLDGNVSLPGGESVASEGFYIPSGCPSELVVWVVAA